MTVHPVLPPLLLAAAAVLVGAQVIALRRWRMSGRNRSMFWRWLLVTSAALLLVLAATRVVITGGDESAPRSAGDTEPSIFLVVDRSPDMAVADLDGRSRMDVARDDMQALIDRYPRARFAVIGFASAPSLDWPLSADTWSLRPVLDTITPYAYSPDAVTQTNAGAASTVLRYQLISAVQQYPRATTLVFYLGAGAPESRLPAREFAPPVGSVDGGAVLGYGTPEGGPIPGTDIDRSPIDVTTLRAVAGQLGVPYVARSDGALPTAELPDAGTADESAVAEATARGQTETYWLPALVAAILILIELYLVLRDFRRSRFVSVDVAP
jgi:Ca-activated chloride channel homolog